MSTSFTCHFKVTSTLKLRLVLSGFFHNLPLSFQIFAIICSSASVCNMSVFLCLFSLMIILSSYLLCFHLPPPWIYWCLFSVSFINAHLLLAPSIVSHSLWCPHYIDRFRFSIHLKCKRQARIQVLCVCVCSFFHSVFCFIWAWSLTAGAIDSTGPFCPTHFCILWFYIYGFSIP